MALSIVRHEAKDFYHPGDTITGFVRSQPISEFEVKHVTISFSGRAKTKLAVNGSGMGSYSWINYRARIELFEDKKILLQGPYTLRKQVYEWPFTFTLPIDCRRGKGDSFGSLAPNGVFDDDPSQPLPPSIRQEFKGNETRDSFYINYELNVELQSSKTVSLHGRDRECKEIITVIPYRSTFSPPLPTTTKSNDFECRSLYLKPTPPSLTERMKSKLSTSSLPSALFTVTATIPTTAITGQQLPVDLSITHNTSASTANTLPQVYLRSWAFRLIERTALRALHEERNPIPQNLSPAGAKTSLWDPEVDFQEYSTKADPVVLSNETLHLNELADLAIPTTKVPSFKTFNINRSYGLKLIVVLECAKEKFTAEFVIPRLILLSGYYGGEKDMNGHDGPPTFEQSMGQYGQNGLSDGIEDKKDPNGPGDMPQEEMGPPPFEAGVNGHAGEGLPGYADVGGEERVMRGEKEDGDLVYR